MYAPSPCKVAKHAGTNHVHHQQLALPIAAILHDHAVPPRLLRRVDDRLTLFEGHDRGHFESCVRPALHRRDSHRRVPLPRCRDVNKIQIVPLTQIFVVVLAVCVNLRLLAAALSTISAACVACSFTESQIAFTCTFGIARKFPSIPVPRPPTPITPSRTVSRASNFTPTIDSLFAAPAAARRLRRRLARRVNSAPLTADAAAQRQPIPPRPIPRRSEAIAAAKPVAVPSSSHRLSSRCPIRWKSPQSRTPRMLHETSPFRVRNYSKPSEIN